MTDVQTSSTERRRGRSGNAAEDERLLKLYWNRADLKKQFRKLSDDKYELEQKLKQQDAGRQRLQERIDSLERLLANPDAGFNAIVFFQLRHLWRTCRAELEKFSRQLRTQQEERDQRQQMMVFNRARGEHAQAIQAKLEPIKGALRQALAEEGALRERVASLGGFWNFFRRRRTETQRVAVAAHCEGLRAEIQDLEQRMGEIEGTDAPAYGGMSVEGRRVINLAVIALAQQLYDFFDRRGLSRLARQAMVKPIEEIKYGARTECLRLMELVPGAIVAMRNEPGLTKTLKARTEALRSVAVYRNDGDTVPVPESLAPALKAVTGPSDAPTVGDPVNVLADEFWDIYAALLQ
jgi:predicted nuclease with TOPRIM domain